MHLPYRNRLTFDVLGAERTCSARHFAGVVPQRGISVTDDGRIMEFHANYVSTGVSVGGDYYRATFTVEEDTDELDSDSPYLLIQSDFEMPYDGSCYVETHDERYRGHFLLRRIEFTPGKLEIELDRPINNLICVNPCSPVAL